VYSECTRTQEVCTHTHRKECIMEHRFQFVLAHKYVEVDESGPIVHAWLVPTCICGWVGGIIYVDEVSRPDHPFEREMVTCRVSCGGSMPRGGWLLYGTLETVFGRVCRDQALSRTSCDAVSEMVALSRALSVCESDPQSSW
jgi:hypothetical protein